MIVSGVYRGELPDTHTGRDVDGVLLQESCVIESLPVVMRLLVLTGGRRKALCIYRM